MSTRRCIDRAGSVRGAPSGLRELVFREDWKATPAARPITQAHVDHPDLVLALHGPGAAQLKKSHHDDLEGDPYYVWSGRCSGAWALSLRHRKLDVDLSHGLIRWRARQSGSRKLRVILKPADRGWLVSERGDDASDAWRDFEIEVAKTGWRRFDIESCTAGENAMWTESAVDGRSAIIKQTAGIGLDRIDAVGVTDCMRGEGSGNCSRLDWIEVWGRAVYRTAP